jgi:SAM-dependent MidA family methyltransferase
MLPLDLAPLTDAERAHEARVRRCIVEAVERAGGWLPFQEFMRLALYAPGLGYYAAGAHKFGAGGDFITAPELSPVFGRCIATQCADVLKDLGGGEIIEIGAGTGALAEQVLSALQEMGVLPSRYRILEISPDLRERQRDRLAHLPAALYARVEWLDAPPQNDIQGVILANEVIDALPVARLRGAPKGTEVLGVSVIEGQLVEVARPASADEMPPLDEMSITLAQGQEIEWCPYLHEWLASVTSFLSRGVALFIDYGESRRHLYTPDRPRGTLVAFHRHRIHNDPYCLLGLQDLTAWVDFTAVAEAGTAAGLEVAGYTTQSCFLLGCGFEEHLQAWRDSLPPDDAALAPRKALKLVLPDDMGTRFKCMALARNFTGAMRGFSIRDFVATL